MNHKRFLPLVALISMVSITACQDSTSSIQKPDTGGSQVVSSPEEAGLRGALAEFVASSNEAGGTSLAFNGVTFTVSADGSTTEFDGFDGIHGFFTSDGIILPTEEVGTFFGDDVPAQLLDVLGDADFIKVDVSDPAIVDLMGNESNNVAPTVQLADTLAVITRLLPTLNEHPDMAAAVTAEKTSNGTSYSFELDTQSYADLLNKRYGVDGSILGEDAVTKLSVVVTNGAVTAFGDKNGMVEVKGFAPKPSITGAVADLTALLAG